MRDICTLNSILIKFHQEILSKTGFPNSKRFLLFDRVVAHLVLSLPSQNLQWPLRQQKPQERVSTIHALILSSGGSRGGDRGSAPPPLIVRPNWGRRAEKKGLEDQAPFPPPYLKFWNRQCLGYVKRGNILWLVYFTPSIFSLLVSCIVSRWRLIDPGLNLSCNPFYVKKSLLYVNVNQLLSF